MAALEHKMRRTRYSDTAYLEGRSGKPEVQTVPKAPSTSGYINIQTMDAEPTKVCIGGDPLRP